jgi:hypothetical protein
MWNEYDREAFIEACKQAWKQLDNQVNKRMLPMKVQAAHSGKYYGANINIGYDVDRDRRSLTFKKYIPNPIQSKELKQIGRRLVELQSVSALIKELEEFPGPHFTQYADPKLHSKCQLKKVPGGYRISTRETLLSILKNKVYRGTWLVGDQEYPGNHAAIFDEDLWVSIQTVLDQEKKGVQRPKKDKEKIRDSLLRGLIYREKGIQISLDLRRGKIIFETKKNPNSLNHRKNKEIPHNIVEDTFKQLFCERLLEDENCYEYAQAAGELHQRELRMRKHLQETVKGLKARYDQLYLDATGANGPVPAGVKQRMYEEMGDLELDIPRLERKLNEPLKTVSYIELKELIDRVKDKKEVFFVEKFKMLINIFTQGIVLERLSPHFWKFEAHWELWGMDGGVIWVNQGGQTQWTPEMLQVLKELHETKASKEEFLAAFPNHSPAAISAMCHVKFNAKLFSCNSSKIESYLGKNDYAVINDYSLKLETLSQELDIFLLLPPAPLDEEDEHSYSQYYRADLD